MYFSDCLVFFVDTATKCTKPWQRQCAVFASATVWQGLLQLAASHQVEDLEWHAVILFFCFVNKTVHPVHPIAYVNFHIDTVKKNMHALVMEV